MKGQLTPETRQPGTEPDLALQPLRLTGQSGPVRRAPHPSRDDRLGRRRRPSRTPSAGGRPAGRHRPGDRRAIAASALAVLALVGCVTAIVMLATAPTAARLEHEIGALSRRLGVDQSRLTELQAAVRRADRNGGRLTRSLGHIAGRLDGLQRTVHGLQGAAATVQNQAAGWRVCVPQLQQELSGLALQTRRIRGRLTSVGLRNPLPVSAPCQALFSGL